MIHFDYNHLKDFYKVLPLPNNMWLLAININDCLLIDTDGKLRLFKGLSFGNYYHDNDFKLTSDNDLDLNLEDFRLEDGFERFIGKEYNVYYKDKLLTSDLCNVKWINRLRENVSPDGFICLTNRKNPKSDCEIVFEKFFGVNSGITFYHPEYGFKSINPDETKNWIFACFSHDNMLCLALHETGGCIIDNPFLN